MSCALSTASRPRLFGMPRSFGQAVGGRLLVHCVISFRRFRARSRFSCIGLPVVNIPVFARGEPPLGVQIIAAPRREDLCLRAAAFLEEAVAVAYPSHGARRLRACAS
jgi:hypothetical protein